MGKALFIDIYAHISLKIWNMHPSLKYRDANSKVGLMRRPSHLSY